MNGLHLCIDFSDIYIYHYIVVRHVAINVLMFYKICEFNYSQK